MARFQSKAHTINFLETALGSILNRAFYQTTTPRVTRCRQTKGLMRRTITLHVHFECWYLSLPSSAKKETTLNDQILRILENTNSNG